MNGAAVKFATKIFVVAAALSALTACAPHTPYTPPAVPPPADYFKAVSYTHLTLPTTPYV